MELMEALVQRRKSLVLILFKQTHNYAWVCITMMIMEKKSLSLNPTITMSTLQLNFVSETYSMDLVLVNLEKYL